MNIDYSKKITDYTEFEFLELLNYFSYGRNHLEGKEHEKSTIEFVKYFVAITEHSAKSDVIFYPREGQEDSPEGILNEVKEWRAQNGKPGFKAS
jgi:hypothetical protein